MLSNKRRTDGIVLVPVIEQSTKINNLLTENILRYNKLIKLNVNYPIFVSSFHMLSKTSFIRVIFTTSRTLKMFTFFEMVTIIKMLTNRASFNSFATKHTKAPFRVFGSVEFLVGSKI